MIRQWIYGTPPETFAVVKEVPLGESLPHFSLEEGPRFTCPLGPEDVVYGLGETMRGINKRGHRYISFNYDDPEHLDDMPSMYGSHNFLVVDGEAAFIGEVSLRYRLNQALLHHGGHIGYGVRYSEWGKGYGTQLLRFALEQAQKRGMDRVLVACLDTNLASARVIEKNGFVLENKVTDTLDGRPVLFRRYWKTL